MARLGSTVEESLSQQGLRRLAVVHLLCLQLRWQGLCIQASRPAALPKDRFNSTPQTGICQCESARQRKSSAPLADSGNWATISAWLASATRTQESVLDGTKGLAPFAAMCSGRRLSPHLLAGALRWPLRWNSGWRTGQASTGTRARLGCSQSAKRTSGQLLSASSKRQEKWT